MDTKNLTFEQLPQAVGLLIEEVKQLRAELAVQKQQEDVWMTIEELSNYLPEHPVVGSIYNWVAKKRIPFHKKGKTLRFLKSEIDDWMK